MYQKGIEVPKDELKAERYLKLAALNGVNISVAYVTKSTLTPQKSSQTPPEKVASLSPPPLKQSSSFFPSKKVTEKSQVTEAQRLLIYLGYLTGPANGVAGPKTDTAVKSFEQAQHSLPTGTIDDKLIVKLKEVKQAKLEGEKSDAAMTLVQLREEQRKEEARLKELKKQTEQLATLRVQKPTKQPVRTDINFGNYHALVIGINSYRNLPRLRTAVTDARAVADVLQRDYGFRTTLLTNATRGEILDTLLSLRNRLTEKDNLLVYYAGHGVLDNAADRGFWLPRNAREPHFASA